MTQTPAPRPIPGALVLVADIFVAESVCQFIGEMVFDQFHDADSADLDPKTAHQPDRRAA